MKRILLITNFVSVPGETYYNRTLFLYDLLVKRGFAVTMVTCLFNHYDKNMRDEAQFHADFPDYDIVFLKAPAYRRNISIRRIINHRVFACRLHRWLGKNGGGYDVIFATMPTQESVNTAGDFCRRNGIPFVIDVRDLWPEAMRVVVKNEFLFNILFRRMKRKADKAYAQADEVIAVSDEYLQRALKVNRKSLNPKVVYLGSTLDLFDTGAAEHSADVRKPDDEIWLIYIGTLGVSYDIKTLIAAYKRLRDAGVSWLRLKILGRGPLEAELRAFARDIGADVDFVGFIDYGRMAAYLKKSDIAVNAIRKNASQSIVNKVADYFAAGIPVLNGSLCAEMRELIDTYQAGLNYQPEDVDSLCSAIEKLLQSPQLQKNYGSNGRRLAEQLFDRKNSYGAIVEILEQMIDKKRCQKSMPGIQ